MTETRKKPDTLLSALLAFQQDAPHIPLDSTNPHFKSKFASLPDVLKIVRPKLAEHGLVLLTMPSQDTNGRPTLRYKLAHAPSGECEEGEMPLLPVKQDPQALGSAITYGRRYAVLAILNLVGDDDDDGNKATGRSDVPANVADFQNGNGDTIDPAFASDLLDECKKRLTSIGQFERFLNGVGVKQLPDAERLKDEKVRLSVLSGLSVRQGSELAKALVTVPAKAAA